MVTVQIRRKQSSQGSRLAIESGKERFPTEIRQPPSGATKQLVQFFKLLADDTRLHVLYFLLQQNELNVRTLCELLGESQPAVSHHLALLRVAGLIESRRDGKHNFYRILPERFAELLELAFGASEDGRTIHLKGLTFSFSPAASERRASNG